MTIEMTIVEKKSWGETVTPFKISFTVICENLGVVLTDGGASLLVEILTYEKQLALTSIELIQ